MLTDFLQPQFRRFLVTGGIAALINLGSRIAYNQAVSYSTAIVLAYLTGMVAAYVLARRFVFTDSNRSTAASAPRFVIVNLFAIVQTWAVSIVLAEHVLPGLGIVRFAHALAHAVGVVVPAFTSFLGHRRWTFRDT